MTANGWLVFIRAIGPLQLVIHVVQNRRAGEQKSHWDKTNKENYHLKLCMSLSCPSATFALQLGGSVVPSEWVFSRNLPKHNENYLT